ncbi:Uncharacterised protein [Salmonella enterica subsp. enterica]|uniref:Uncharacterized protein n=1 Tax=Salmonella enterica I TaxID=59201 RepID=A0A379WPG6_SALET|nr:Uncharacterised protein [Salmonella enterica subsp. enterica]
MPKRMQVLILKVRCAEFTRKAIQAGGITLGHTYHAKDYGPNVKKRGFTAIGYL